MNCEPQGIKIKVEDYIKANENSLNKTKKQYREYLDKILSEAIRPKLRNCFNLFGKPTEKELEEKINKGFAFFDLSQNRLPDKEMIELYFLEPDYQRYELNKKMLEITCEEYVWVNEKTARFVGNNL